MTSGPRIASASWSRLPGVPRPISTRRPPRWKPSWRCPASRRTTWDIQLFENVLVVEGQRRLPVATPEVLYHTAGIRQGAFQIALALPARIDPDGLQARYDRGLLLITLPKRGATA
jgi:hypothetical protein